MKMIRRFVLVLLVTTLAGCGGDSKSDSDSNSDSGDKKQSAANDPGGKQPSTGEQGKDKDAGKSAKGSGKGGARKDGIFNASANMRDQNKLKMIAIGMHNFHDTMRMFPQAAPGTDKFNKDLSWRVLVLPYVEFQNEYEQFDLSQAWDSEKNKPLADSQAKDAFVLGNGNLICAIKHDKQPKALLEIIDGSSNTIAFLESPVADGDKWTSPEDIDAKDAVKIIKSLKKGEYLFAAFYDGSVQKIYSPEGKNLKDEEIAALFGHRDGMIINDAVFGPSK